LVSKADGFISLRDMMDDGRDSFLSKLARAQKTHNSNVADSIELMKNCSFVCFYN